MAAQLTIESPQQAKLSGKLNHKIARDIEQQGLAALSAAKQSWSVDLSGVEQSNSVGVAVLLSWLRAAKQQGKNFEVQSLPDNMQQIIEFSGLNPVFSTIDLS